MDGGRGVYLEGKVPHLPNLPCASWYALSQHCEAPIYFSKVGSIIIIVILRDKDVMLLQESGKVLADQSSHIKEGHHHYCHADKTKRRLASFIVTSFAKQSVTIC